MVKESSRGEFVITVGEAAAGMAAVSFGGGSTGLVEVFVGGIVAVGGGVSVFEGPAWRGVVVATGTMVGKGGWAGGSNRQAGNKVSRVKRIRICFIGLSYDNCSMSR
jgi:hypothetical protein